MALQRTLWLLSAVFLLAAVSCVLSQEKQGDGEKKGPTTIRPRPVTQGGPRPPPPRQQRDLPPPPGGSQPASTPRPATIHPPPPGQKPGR